MKTKKKHFIKRIRTLEKIIAEATTRLVELYLNDSDCKNNKKLGEVIDELDKIVVDSLICDEYEGRCYYTDGSARCESTMYGYRLRKILTKENILFSQIQERIKNG